MSFNPLKSLKKGIKSVARAGKKLTSGVGKVFKSAFKEVKRFAQSDLGKLAIAGALIYFGGAAFATQAAPAAGTQTALAASTAVPTSAAAAAPIAAPVVAPAAAAGAPAAVSPLAAAPSVGAPIAPALVPPVVPPEPGLLSKLATGVADRPGLALLGGGQVLSALTAPDPGADAIALEKWRREQSNIAGVGYGGGGTPLGGSRRTTKAELEASTRRYV